MGMIHVKTTPGCIYVLDLYNPPVMRWLQVICGELNSRGTLFVFPNLRVGVPLIIEGTLLVTRTREHVDFYMQTHPIEAITWLPEPESKYA